MRKKPWYQQYESLSERVQQLRIQFVKRCEALGADPNVALSEIRDELVIRAVQESNWQEGIYLDQGMTRELALHVFDDLRDMSGPRIDYAAVLKSHRRQVTALKRKRFSTEEIAAHNLTAAYVAVSWIGSELMHRILASLAYALQRARDENPSLRKLVNEQDHDKLDKGFQEMDMLLNSASEFPMPITDGITTQGSLMQQLMQADFDSLIHPMAIDHIHFLHRVVMMGIADSRVCGSLRTCPVHVGNPDLLLPAPSLLPGMMNEYCRTFPAIAPTAKYDPIIEAARASHRFAQIHPYRDGNGRVSRLLMNLVLWLHHPPVYLKADKKGRHRYGQALRRADRGSIEPLACLIASNLITTYTRLIETAGSSAAPP